VVGVGSRILQLISILLLETIILISGGGLTFDKQI
jgi:hypothetical protein